jgi:hypothetical protein
MIISNFPAAGGAKLRIYTGSSAPSDTGGIWIAAHIFREITVSNDSALPATTTCACCNRRAASTKISADQGNPWLFAHPVMGVLAGTAWEG